jgi:hypothetical protein
MDRKMRDRMANLPPTQSIKRKTEGDTEKVRPLLQISLLLQLDREKEGFG